MTFLFSESARNYIDTTHPNEYDIQSYLKPVTRTPYLLHRECFGTSDDLQGDKPSFLVDVKVLPSEDVSDEIIIQYLTEKVLLEEISYIGVTDRSIRFEQSCK